MLLIWVICVSHTCNALAAAALYKVTQITHAGDLSNMEVVRLQLERDRAIFAIKLPMWLQDVAVVV